MSVTLAGVVRLPAVMPSSGTRSVSAMTRRTCSTGTLSSSAAAWVSSARGPSPSSTFPLSAVIVPSSFRKIRAETGVPWAEASGLATVMSRPDPRACRKVRRSSPSRGSSMRRSRSLSGSRMALGSHGHRGPADRLHDLHVPVAAAEVAVHPGDDLLVGGVGLLAQQCRCGEDHAAHAVPALHGALVEERLLYGVEGVPAGQALDGRDRLAGDGAQREQARACR